MLILRIRRAETALADGRLDEAFRLAQDPDLQAHHKGQELIGRLARALVSRGEEHLSAGRCEQATADCEKAGALAGGLPEVAGLRTAVAQVMTERVRRERRQGDLLAVARENVDNGRLSIGENCLAEAKADSARVADLRNQAAQQRAKAEAALDRARQALDREDFPAAAAALLEARQAHPVNSRGCELMTDFVRKACGAAAATIDTGRLDLAEAMLEPVIRVGGESIEVRELSRLLNGCREALAGVKNGQPRAAGETLRRLAAIRPGAAWMACAAQSAEQAAEHLQTLRSGPLGLLEIRSGWQGQTQPDGGQANTEKFGEVARAPVAQEARVDAAVVANKLLLQVDGVGSFLVLRDRRVTIGPASSSRRPEIGLLAEPNLPSITVERTDEDYFVSCEGQVCVNDALTARKLLANGDRIALSPRARLRFARPNAASASAVLQLSGTRLPSCDARQVILLDRELIVGPGPSAHVRADHLAEPAILQVRDGRLFCKSKEPVMVNDRPMDRHVGLPLGARVQIGAISFVITAVK